MSTTVGTCSICGGRVSIPSNWSATVPPTPTCESCGATKKQPHGPVIDMDDKNPKTLKQSYSTPETFRL